MSRLSARLQSEPVGSTCPLIDSVIARLDNDVYTGDIIETLEKIRDANAALRDWGNSLLGQYEDLESEFQEKEEQLKKAIEQLEDFKNTIEYFLRHEIKS